MLRFLLSNLLREVAQDHVRAAMGEAQASVRQELAKNQQAIDALPPIDIAIVFALGIESGGLVDRLDESYGTLKGAGYVERLGRIAGKHVAIIESGVGIEQARRAVEDVLRIRQPMWAISAGFAGGLHAAPRRGHVIMADSVVDESGRELSIGLTVSKAALEATRGVHVGRLLCVDRLIHEPEEKRALGEKHAALACDMETIAVAQACREAKTRLLSVRIISDAVDERLPRDIEKLLGKNKLARQLGAAAGTLIRRPSSAKDLWKLREDALDCSNRLAKFLIGVMEQLPAKEVPKLPPPESNSA